MTPPLLVVLGCGFTGTEAARQHIAHGGRVIATTRDPARAERLRTGGLDAHALAALDGAWVRTHVSEGARVLATFPPDGETDACVVAALPSSCRCVYLSTTGVYGARRGVIDADTPTDDASPKAHTRLDAERCWRARGAVVLRAAGIYGPSRGLHRRLLDGTFRLPDDGDKVVSRIHVEDLAALCLAALERGPNDTAWPVADDAPTPQVEVVRWLAARLGVPMPPRAPVEAVPETLRHHRIVDNRAVKVVLGATLRYPTWREGFERCLAVEAGATA